MNSSSFSNHYEAPITSETFKPSNSAVNGPPFLFKPADLDFVEGRTHTLPPDWNVFISVATLVIVALVIALVTLPPVLLLMNLNQNGVNTQAVVSGESQTSGKSTTYYVYFSYSVNGQSYNTRQSVQYGTYLNLGQGSPVAIRYLPDDPTQARLSGASADESTITLDFIILAVGVLTVVISLYWLNIHMQRTRRLVAGGQLIDGEVVEAHVSRSKSSYSLKLTYGFTSPASGQALTRSESAGRNDLRNNTAPAPNTPVKVLFLDDNTYRVL